MSVSMKSPPRKKVAFQKAASGNFEALRGALDCVRDAVERAEDILDKLEGSKDAEDDGAPAPMKAKAMKGPARKPMKAKS